ncbi:MAG: hypothetical protein OEV18_17015, partial [Deltaproteobacteria bacterium]|nr:hypothetical protein [Deltaproteobacteria bacterium]
RMSSSVFRNRCLLSSDKVIATLSSSSCGSFEFSIPLPAKRSVQSKYTIDIIDILYIQAK